jgi:hypothetical protein
MYEIETLTLGGIFKLPRILHLQYIQHLKLYQIN